MSYSNPTRMAGRVGPTILFGLTAESGSIPDDTITQAMLDAASLEINVKVGTRYGVPVTNKTQVNILAALEEQIALWFLYVRRGIGEQETAASAAKIGYDNAFKTLQMLATAQIDLDGAALRDDPSDQGGGFILKGERPHFNPPEEDSLDFFDWPPM